MKRVLHTSWRLVLTVNSVLVWGGVVESLGLPREAIRISAKAVGQRWPYFVGENIP